MAVDLLGDECHIRNWVRLPGEDIWWCNGVIWAFLEQYCALPWKNQELHFEALSTAYHAFVLEANKVHAERDQLHERCDALSGSLGEQCQITIN